MQHHFLVFSYVTYKSPKHLCLKRHVPGYLLELAATLKMERRCPSDLYVTFRDVTEETGLCEPAFVLVSLKYFLIRYRGQCGFHKIAVPHCCESTCA